MDTNQLEVWRNFLPDSYKQGELMDIAGDPKYQNPDGSMNEQGAALASSIEDTFHQPQH